MLTRRQFLRSGAAVAGGVLAGGSVVTLGQALLTAGRGGSIIAPHFNVTKLAGNPVIAVADNPNESLEQYTPSPIRLPNGDIWVYVKGTSRIYAWKSTDDGVTFSLENSGNPVIAPVTSTWESATTYDPCAVYDPDTDTVHLYYKGGTDPNGSLSWGHATAPGSNPASMTKDAGNPILTASEMATLLGSATVTDNSCSCVLLIDGTYHFFGYVFTDSRYRLIHATGSDWDTITAAEEILVGSSSTNVVQTPSVFQHNGQWGMFYTDGAYDQSPGSREIFVVRSNSIDDWTFTSPRLILTPTQAWEEDRTYAASLLTDGYGPAPIEDDDGRWKLYYSGSTATAHESGLAYLVSSP